MVGARSGAPRAHEVVVAWVRQGLSTGLVHVGDRLPGERALAAELAVSRASVREAMRVMESMGVIRAATGSGPESGSIVVAEPSSAIGDTVSMHLAYDGMPRADIIETRVLLESWAVSTAALRSSRATGRRLALSQAELQLTAMSEPDVSVADFLEADLAFHLSMARASGNAVVGVLLGSLRHAIAGYVAEVAQAAPDWTLTKVGLCAQHERIHQHVLAAEPDAAAVAVTRHIRGFLRAGVTRSSGS